MARKPNYRPSSKPIVPNPGRTFPSPGISARASGDDVSRGSYKGARPGMARTRANQQTGATKGKTT